eukprot:gene5101-5607_t
MPGLDYLYLDDNALRGTIPSTLGNLRNLRVFSLSNNIDIRGTIPMGLANLTALQHLLLNNCSLTGSLPSGLGSQINLYEVDVGFNYLTEEESKTQAVSQDSTNIELASTTLTLASSSFVNDDDASVINAIHHHHHPC